MGKRKKQRMIHLSTKGKDDLNKHFFIGYDYKHWVFRVKTNTLILNQLERFIKEFGDTNLQDEPIEEYKLSLQMEFISMFYHTSEAIFLIIMSMLETRFPIWVTMSQVRTNKIHEFIKKVLIPKKLTADNIKLYFYYKLDVQASENVFNKSLEFIREYLARIGKFYTNNKIYNDYKHGLRVMRTKRMQMGIKREGDPNVKYHEFYGGPCIRHLNFITLKQEVNKESNTRIDHTQIERKYLRYLILNYISD